LNVPRLLRLPVFGFFFREYSRYSPEASFRIIGLLSKGTTLSALLIACHWTARSLLSSIENRTTRLHVESLVVRSVLLSVAVLILSVISRPAIADPAQVSVWIEVKREDGVRFNKHPLPREGEGMGVITSSREIATAAHVVSGAKLINITDANGAKVPARVACIDKKVDVAILRAEQPLEHFATIRSKPVVTGERVGVVEHRRPSGTPNTTFGKVEATKWTSHGTPVPLIFSGIKGEKGMSGGGLFDKTGQLVGIIVRVDSTLGYLSALPAVELFTRLSRCARSSR
jgi:S1-C subfamily serine protease